MLIPLGWISFSPAPLFDMQQKRNYVVYMDLDALKYGGNFI